MAWTLPLQSTALSLALLWLLLALVQRRKPALLIVWALFCASIAMFMAQQLAGEAVSPWHYLIGLGTCATCNGYWLVSRALFREGRPFGAPHLLYAGLIGALIVGRQLFGLMGDGLGWVALEARAPIAAALSEALGLLSSTALVLAFWEALRGWRDAGGMERWVRAVFLLTYGACVAICSAAPALSAATGAALQMLDDTISAAASLAILLVTQGLVHWRLRHPLDAEAAVTATTPMVSLLPAVAPAAGPVLSPTPVGSGRLDLERLEPERLDPERAEDLQLAAALEQRMQGDRLYLRTDLKLTHLAQALDVSEYRISRAIHGPLGHRNVSHYINRYRVVHARALLDDPSCDDWSTLVIGLESGFGSLGAFHRAFKSLIDSPPGEYRAARSAPTAASGGQSTQACATTTTEARAPTIEPGRSIQARA